MLGNVCMQKFENQANDFEEKQISPRKEMEDSNMKPRHLATTIISKVKPRVIHVKPVEEMTPNYGKFFIDDNNMIQTCEKRDNNTARSEGEAKQNKNKKNLQATETNWQMSGRKWQATGYLSIDKKDNESLPNIN